MNLKKKIKSGNVQLEKNILCTLEKRVILAMQETITLIDNTPSVKINGSDDGKISGKTLSFDQYFDIRAFYKMFGFSERPFYKTRRFLGSFAIYIMTVVAISVSNHDFLSFAHFGIFVAMALCLFLVHISIYVPDDKLYDFKVHGFNMDLDNPSVFIDADTFNSVKAFVNTKHQEVLNK